jgi:la-related protein 1
MPAFSYAQAAKGLAPTKPKDDPVGTSAKPTSTPDSNNSQPPSRVSQNRARAEDKAPAATAKEAPTPSSTADEPLEKENIPPNKLSQQMSEATASSAASPSLSGVIASPKEKELTQRLDRSDSWEKASHTSAGVAGVDKDNNTVQKEKVKESEDDWEKVSVPSVGGDKEKELKPAPPPPVNFWTARKEANEAKLRDITGQRTAAATQSAPPTAVAKAPSFVEASKSKPSPKESVNKEVTSNSRRSNESGRANGKNLSIFLVRPCANPSEQNEPTCPLHRL